MYYKELSTERKEKEMLTALELTHTQRDVFSLIGAECVELAKRDGTVSLDDLMSSEAVRSAVQIVAQAYCQRHVRRDELRRLYFAARQKQQRGKINEP